MNEADVALNISVVSLTFTVFLLSVQESERKAD